MNFTESELITISNGLIALIRDAGEAKKLVHSEKIQKSIDEEINQLVTLNSKVCGMMKE